MVQSKSLTARLKAQGFDKARPIRDGFGGVSVGCSQCEALCINGVACHEIGCPNKARAEREERAEG